MVDGEPVWRRTVGRVFESRGHRVLELGRGSELAPKLATVDGVVLDSTLADMSGIELITRMRKERADLPIVVVTADAHVDSVVRAMRLGVVDYVTKPADQKRLSEAADRLIEACSFQGVSMGLTRLPTLDEIEKRAIDCALTITKGQVSQAARMLGIGRATLYRKLAEMGRTPSARAARAAAI